MQDSASNNDEWGEPLSLEGRSLLQWPKNVFPEILEEFACELARSTETPVELSAMLALAVVATASQKKYQIQVKEGYCEPTNLWVIGILPPASRKSRVYREATVPLKRWELEQKVIVTPRIQSLSSARKTMEARLKGLRAQSSKMANDSDFDKLQEQIESLESKMLEVPGYPQIWASDVTNEQLGVIMEANGNAMALLSDEGGIFDIIGGLYSDGRSNIDLLLQSHSAGSIRVDRGSRPPIFMERAVLTMGLTVQPSVVKKICENKTYRGRGLLGRFLYVIPKSNIGTRTLEEPPMSSECIKSFEIMIAAILEQPTTDLHMLQLDEEAYGKWLEYAKCNEALMGEGIGYLSHITDWAGKLPGTIVRIAGLLHIFRYVHHRPEEYRISAQDMASAIKIGHVLTSHALVVFDLLQEDEAINIARSIYLWIKEQKSGSFSLRECERKFRRYKKDDLKKGLALLEDSEIVRRWEKHSQTGRKSEIYSVNPKVLKEE